MHPFTNSHFHFLFTVESATSQVLLQWPRQMTVQQGKIKDYRVDGPQVTTEMTVTAPMFDMCCVRLHRHAEGSHLMTDVQVSNSLTHVSASKRVFTLLVVPCCITEYRMTHFEFLAFGVVQCFHVLPLFFVRGLKWHTYVSPPVSIDSVTHFLLCHCTSICPLNNI